MSTPRLLLAAVAALGLGAADVTFAPWLTTSPAYAQNASVSFSIFFDRLSNEGRWVKHSRYRYVWCPEVERTWAPYTNGHWIYLADRGWYFQSDEPFAWAVYHYGRWFRDTDLGWCWVPGNVWAPAWVSWRRSTDYIGWAPLQPESNGFAVGVTISSTEPPRDDWFFVPTRSFVEPQLRNAVVFASDKPYVFQRTRFAGAVVVHNDVVVNNVISVNIIQQATKQQVPVVKAEVVTDPGQLKQPATESGIVPIFQAKVEAPRQDAAPKQAEDATQAAKEIKAGTPPKNAGQGTGAATNNNGATDNGVTSNQPNDQTSAGQQKSVKPGPEDNPAASENATQKPGRNDRTNPACAQKDMLNGACPPATQDKSKPAHESSKPADGTRNDAVTNGPNAGSKAPSASSLEQNQESAAGAGQKTENFGGTTKNSGIKPTGSEKSGSFDCPNGKVVQGICQTGEAQSSSKSSRAGSSDNAPSQQIKPGNDKGVPAVSGSRGGGESGKPKGNVQCGPGETLVNGACAPRGNKGGNDGGGQ